MRQSNIYTFIFVTIVSLAAALILSLTSQLLRERQRLNVETDMKRNILTAVGLMDRGLCRPAQGSAAGGCSDIACCYESNIKSLVLDSRGMEVGSDIPAENIDPEEEREREPEKRRLPLFIRMDGGKETSYCIPLVGKGLWSTLYGYLALRPDLNTVAGITFYKHAETPGLGAEIEKGWFLDGFRGKKIFGKEGELRGISVMKGKAQKSSSGFMHQVDGISGATLTGDGVTKLIRQSLEPYEAYFSAKRRNSRK